MDTVVNKLLEIEETVGAIADEANVREKAFAKEMEDRTASSDTDLERKTTCRIAGIQHKMEVDMEDMLARQKAGLEVLLKQLEGNYDQRHAACAGTLFQNMIEG